MSTKEVTVYVVDVGSTMGEISHGRTKSNLDWALEYVWDRVSATIATGRKTAMVGVVGLRTDETENPLGDEEDYHHIHVLKEIDQALMPDVRRLRERLVVSNTATGDTISALVIAIQMIVEKCKKLKYDRRIVLVTDGRAIIQSEDLSAIKHKIKEDNIELIVLGVDFDDSEYGFKEEDKDPLKEENERLLQQFCMDVDGVFGTLVQAIDEMQAPRLKNTRSVASYKGVLTLGNAQQYDDALTIDVERYPKTMKATPPSASSFALRSGLPDATQSTQTLSNGETGTEDASGGLSAIKNARTYQVVDENAPGGKRDVERDELSKGYEYGRTAVHISESDQNVTKFETTAGFDVLGFVDKKQHCRYLNMNRANIIVSQRHNEKASMALSSFIHALYELDSYAVARLVEKDNKDPKILLLAPNIEPDFECLFDVQLPFAEDVRNYKFPPLDRVITVSGKELKSHRNLPADDLLEAMSDYVDSMDLSAHAKDEEGNNAEYAPINETFNPMIHRLNQVIQHRAVYPEDGIPEPLEACIKYANPPHDLVKQAQPFLDRVIKTGEVKRVPPKARGKQYGRKEVPKPLSDLDVAALLAVDPQRKGKRIDPKNAVPGFKQMLEIAEKQEELQDACKQLKHIIFDWVKHSVGDSKYGQALEAIHAMRLEMIEYELPGFYNDFVQDLKKKIMTHELGENKTEFWAKLWRTGRPITKHEAQGSEFTDDEAKAFMSLKRRDGP